MFAIVKSGSITSMPKGNKGVEIDGIKHSFNSITVDGDTSTNDSVFFAATCKKENISINSFKNNVTFPVYLYSHQPKGVGANWNNCLKHANGYYIFQNQN